MELVLRHSLISRLRRELLVSCQTFLGQFLLLLSLSLVKLIKHFDDLLPDEFFLDLLLLWATFCGATAAINFLQRCCAFLVCCNYGCEHALRGNLLIDHPVVNRLLKGFPRRLIGLFYFYQVLIAPIATILMSGQRLERILITWVHKDQHEAVRCLDHARCNLITIASSTRLVLYSCCRLQRNGVHVAFPLGDCFSLWFCTTTNIVVVVGGEAGGRNA